jgi:hypothetical protein
MSASLRSDPKSTALLRIDASSPRRGGTFPSRTLHGRRVTTRGEQPAMPKQMCTQMSETESEKRSLYDRLGGVYSIATVVEDLIEGHGRSQAQRQSAGG